MVSFPHPTRDTNYAASYREDPLFWETKESNKGKKRDAGGLEDSRDTGESTYTCPGVLITHFSAAAGPPLRRHLCIVLTRVRPLGTGTHPGDTTSRAEVSTLPPEAVAEQGRNSRPSSTSSRLLFTRGARATR